MPSAMTSAMSSNEISVMNARNCRTEAFYRFVAAGGLMVMTTFDGAERDVVIVGRHVAAETRD